MSFVLPFLAFVMVLGFTLCLCGFIENRAERRDPLLHLDADRARVNAALDASRKYTGRAWLPGEITTSASGLRAGARRGASESSDAEVVPLRSRAASVAGTSRASGRGEGRSAAPTSNSVKVARPGNFEQTSEARHADARSKQTASSNHPFADARPSLSLVASRPRLDAARGLLALVRDTATTTPHGRSGA